MIFHTYLVSPSQASSRSPQRYTVSLSLCLSFLLVIEPRVFYIFSILENIRLYLWNIQWSSKLFEGSSSGEKAVLVGNLRAPPAPPFLLVHPSQTGFLGLYQRFLLLFRPRAFALAARSSIFSQMCAELLLLLPSGLFCNCLLIKAVLRSPSAVTFCISPLLCLLPASTGLEQSLDFISVLPYHFSCSLQYQLHRTEILSLLPLLLL